MVEVTVDKKTVPMEIDTGASVSIVSESTFRHIWSRRAAPGLRHPRITLRTYTGERIQLLGELDVAVRYDGQVAKLPILVEKGDGPNLLCRDWLRKLKLDWTNICKVCGHTHRDLSQVIDKYAEVFAEGLGTLEGVTTALYVDPQARPRFHKARSTNPLCIEGDSRYEA